MEHDFGKSASLPASVTRGKIRRIGSASSVRGASFHTYSQGSSEQRLWTAVVSHIHSMLSRSGARAELHWLHRCAGDIVESSCKIVSSSKVINDSSRKTSSEDLKHTVDNFFELDDGPTQEKTNSTSSDGITIDDVCVKQHAGSDSSDNRVAALLKESDALRRKVQALQVTSDTNMDLYRAALREQSDAAKNLKVMTDRALKAEGILALHSADDGGSPCVWFEVFEIGTKSIARKTDMSCQTNHVAFASNSEASASSTPAPRARPQSAAPVRTTPKWFCHVGVNTEPVAESSGPSAQHSATSAYVPGNAPEHYKLQIDELEQTVSRLIRERDNAMHYTKSKYAELVTKLEEQQEELDNSSSEWAEKQKELERLRILMRFSQLKKDSDELPVAYQRVDALEAQLRRLKFSADRSDFDREDYRRLRQLEVHCKRAVQDEGALSDIPLHLLEKPKPKLPQPTDVPQPDAPSTQEAPKEQSVKGSDVAAAVLRQRSLVRPMSSPAIRSTSVREPSETPLSARADNASAQKQQDEKDVPFNVIANRMQQYMDRRKQFEEQASAKKAEASLPSRPKRVGSAPARRPVHPGTTSGLSLPSTSRRIGNASARGISVNTEVMVPRSFSFIGGKAIPLFHS